MKVYFILLFYFQFSLLQILCAQEPIRFANRYYSKLDQPEFNNVFVTDSCYWISGWGADTTYPYLWNARFAKIGLNGDLLLDRYLVDTGKIYGWPRGIFYHDNKLFSSYLQPYDSIRIIAYDLILDTLYDYYSYGILNSNEFGLFGGNLFINNVGEQIMVANTGGDSLLAYDSHIQFIKINSEKKVIHEKIYLITEGIIGTYGVKQVSNGNIWIYGIQLKSVYQNGNDNSARDFLLIVNNNGDSLMTIKGKSYFTYGIKDILIDDDGNFIYGTVILTHPVGSEGILGYPSVIKMDSSGKANWTIKPDSTDKCDSWASYSQIKKIVKSNNNSYTALSGIEVKYDSLDPFYPSWDARICIFNFTGNGKKFWERTFSFGYGAESTKAFDLKVTDDGGYIIAGESYLGSPLSREEFSYLIKTDSFGCIIPGCHLLVKTDNQDNFRQEELFDMYPNPVKNNLLILLSKLSADTGILSIYNINGLLIKKLNIKPDRGVQYIIKLPELIPGTYFINIEGQEYKWVKQFVME